MKNLELDAARSYKQTCDAMYPDIDMMDEQTLKEYTKCCVIIQKAEIQRKKDEYYAEQQMLEEEHFPRPVEKQPIKKKGKIARFEEDVIECLRQGYGEEKQLLDEAYARKNFFARRNYVQAYYRAVNKFNHSR